MYITQKKDNSFSFNYTRGILSRGIVLLSLHDYFLVRSILYIVLKQFLFALIWIFLVVFQNLKGVKSTQQSTPCSPKIHTLFMLIYFTMVSISMFWPMFGQELRLWTSALTSGIAYLKNTNIYISIINYDKLYLHFIRFNDNLFNACHIFWPSTTFPQFL